MDISSLIPSFGGLAWTVVAFVVALSIIVFVHEYGHYIVGRWSGIHAEVFSLGFGPVLASRDDRRGTRWQIAALPFGGYRQVHGRCDAASGKDADGDRPADRGRAAAHDARRAALGAGGDGGGGAGLQLHPVDPVFTGFFMVQGVATDAADGGQRQAHARRRRRAAAGRP